MDTSFHLGDDGIYRCQAFQCFIWQSHGFGTRHKNPLGAVTLRQIHSDIVVNAHGLVDRGQDGDALITNDLALSIGVRTADCVPILLLDTQNRAVGAVHAGWRGSKNEIVRCAIHKLAAEFGSPPAHILAAIGPCIRECCYEVGADVSEQFDAVSPPKANGKRNLDLVEANRRQMLASGIPESQIFDSCLCTCCHIETFYSYRRDPGETARMTSAITRLS